MFVTLEKFFKDYRIKNGQAPNETVMNRGTMRLKREIRELKTFYDLMQGNQIETWDRNRVYEVDEYVDYNTFIYRSLMDGNFNDPPDTSTSWERVNIKRIEDNYMTLKSNVFNTEEGQQVFNLDFNSKSVIVFLDGVLQDQDVYNYEHGVVGFNEPLEADRTVTVISSIGYESALLLPKKEFYARQDQYEFETEFELTQPSVFVDGKLIPEADYTYEQYKVILDTPVDENTVVVVCNGNTTGSECYTKEEIDRLLEKVLTTDNCYTKDQIDEMKENTLNDINDLYRLKSESYTINQIDNKFTYYYTKSEIDEMLNGQMYTTLAEYGITDAYTKTECDNLFASKHDLSALTLIVNDKADKATTLEGYGITDAYTKTEVDDLLRNKADKATTLSGYGITDTYTKTEVDLLLNSVTITVDDLDLSEYAKKATTLAGYGITDTYTKPEVDALINNAKIDPQQVQEIIENTEIDAKYLDGFSADQFVRSDQKDEQIFGVNFRSKFELNDQSTISVVPEEIPEIGLSYKARENPDSSGSFRVEERVFSSLNSNDLYFIADGDFKGTWFENIYHFGIQNPNSYNWFVNVFPIMDGDSLSFVPKGYDSGFKFVKYENRKDEYESSFYHYGYIDNDQVKLYSYYKSGSEFIPSYSHYQLIGIKKTVSTHVRFNQGDQPLQPIQFNDYDELDIAFNNVQNTQKEINYSNEIINDIELDNILINDSVTTNERDNSLYVEPSVNEIKNAQHFSVIVRGGIPNAPVSFTLRGDVELVECDQTFNEVGCAVLIGKGKSPYTEKITVIAHCEGLNDDFCVINMNHIHVDDPDTTLNWDNTGWDYTVFSSTDEYLYEDDPDSTLNWDTNGFDNTVFSNKS